MRCEGGEDRASGGVRDLAGFRETVMPAFAGIQGVVILDSRLRGNDMREQFGCLRERVSRETEI
jgi:hypothetical protein